MERCVILRYIAPGEVFGTQALLRGGIYPADAIAVTSCIELQWSARVRSRSWCRGIRASRSTPSAELEARLRQMESRLMDLSNEPVDQRIAHALVHLVEKFGRTHGRGDVEVPFPVRCQDVADMTGTTLHTVSRTLGAWEVRSDRARPPAPHHHGCRPVDGADAEGRPNGAPAPAHPSQSGAEVLKLRGRSRGTGRPRMLAAWQEGGTSLLSAKSRSEARGKVPHAVPLPRRRPVGCIAGVNSC